jgi:hypothetical protein
MTNKQSHPQQQGRLWSGSLFFALAFDPVAVYSNSLGLQAVLNTLPRRTWRLLLRRDSVSASSNVRRATRFPCEVQRRSSKARRRYAERPLDRSAMARWWIFSGEDDLREPT